MMTAFWSGMVVASVMWVCGIITAVNCFGGRSNCSRSHRDGLPYTEDEWQDIVDSRDM